MLEIPRERIIKFYFILFQLEMKIHGKNKFRPKQIFKLNKFDCRGMTFSFSDSNSNIEINKYISCELFTKRCNINNWRQRLPIIIRDWHVCNSNGNTTFNTALSRPAVVCCSFFELIWFHFIFPNNNQI